MIHCNDNVSRRELLSDNEGYFAFKGRPTGPNRLFFLTLFKQFSNDMGNFIAFNVGAIVESVNKKKT